MDFSFKSFMEMADYGYDRERNRKFKYGGTTGMPEEKTSPVNAEAIMEELKRLPPIGSLNSRWSWSNIMEWGDDVGAIKIDISPFGSYKAAVRRKIYDLQGEVRWILKGSVPLDTEPVCNQSESVIAHELYEIIGNIAHQQVERAEKDCPTFERVCTGIAAKCRQHHPVVFLYRGTKKINDHYFKVFFEYRGQGVEIPGNQRGEQFDINVQFDPKIGLIRCWGCEITSPKGQHLWQVSPSEWDEYFSPTQDKDEIIRCVRTILNTY